MIGWDMVIISRDKSKRVPVGIWRVDDYES